MNLDNKKIRDLLQNFEFKKLFIEELNWSQPNDNKEIKVKTENVDFRCKMLSHLSGVTVFEVMSSDNKIPTKKNIKQEVFKEISKYYHENLIIFIDEQKTQSLWYWVKRDGSKKYPREHFYFKGQPGDLFLSKLSSMVIDISEFDQYGNLPITEVADKLKKALDIEKITKKFYREFKEQHDKFLDFIEGIEDSKEKSWYASILLNRLMFIYFLQRKGFIDNKDINYLTSKLNNSKKVEKDGFYSSFLKKLFFEGFAKPEEKRSIETNKLLGKIKYLNGGLFLEHSIEKNNKISISDEAFDNIFNLFESYSWNLNDIAGGKDNEINPDVLGYIFEKYINQKEFGAYYTKPEITEYLCEKTIYKFLVEKINNYNEIKFDSISDVLIKLDEKNCRILFREILPNLSILDPSCGSGAFLVSAMKTLINIYSAILGKIEFLSDNDLKNELKKINKEHSSIAYFIKKQIITNNLFGVDIIEEASEIAKLRLFLALVASAEKIEDLEPLPNIDFNIMAGNSLVGLLQVSSDRYDEKKQKEQLGLFQSNKTYSEIVKEKDLLVKNYRNSDYADDLSVLKDNIKAKKQEAYKDLNQILLDDFNDLNIKYEEAIWDDEKNKLGKAKKRSLKIEDINNINPFHWGYEFDQILNERGGFDIIITNPPWDMFQVNSKEFLESHSELISKNKMSIKDFEKELNNLMKDKDIKKSWLEYISTFAHLSMFFRSSPQYKNQICYVNNKRQGTEPNLYKLFTEQCFNLIKKGGHCGIVIPSGIYTDIGAKQLREMIFEETELTGLFCFENRKQIFENVHRSFKFVVLTFEKGRKTKLFPASFMKHDVSDLQKFPKEGALYIDIDLIKKTSPDSFSIMEFKNELDVNITHKMLKYPLLGEEKEDTWNLVLRREFNMTDDAYLFNQKYEKGMLPLYEGKMMHQFTHIFSEPRYWIKEDEGRKALLGKNDEKKQKLEYQEYRLAYRSIASSTNERTIISTILPPNVFCGNSLNLNRNKLDPKVMIYLVSMFNSFILDFYIRIMVSANVNMFYMYQLPLPRLKEKDKIFDLIIKRAVKLICTTSEFDNLAKEIGLNSKEVLRNDFERMKVRAELDAIIAHLYNLTEEEFTYILSTFPIVPEPTRLATQNAYRDYNNGLIK